jgi:hypothetical protein
VDLTGSSLVQTHFLLFTIIPLGNAGNGSNLSFVCTHIPLVLHSVQVGKKKSDGKDMGMNVK